jgi:hypothetical protein
MNIDLTHYVVAKWGTWFLDKEAFSPSELRLATLADGVTLAGPLRVRLCLLARNNFTLVGSGAVALQTRDVLGYTLDIPPGQLWTYPAPRLTGAAEGVAPTGEAAGAGSLLDREALWGANAGFGLSIRSAGPEACADPCAPDPCRPVDPCAPKKKCGCGGRCGCGGGSRCGCECEEHDDDLPCDFATGSGSHAGHFFPAACEPCTPGAAIGMPAIKGPSLLVSAARGGTVRTRYFNGMFITKEDLWTDQNNNRIKHALMNRAMGQGVVWGLDVHLDGDAICVLPGYGVDCCGNDVVISSAYRVDRAALVRDPAAAATLAKARAARMNLLLEYFECPEEPRPVHGDPCAPETVSCEMSRIRETARLRLVPPCDVGDSGPIKDFLDYARKLKGDPIVAPIIDAASGIAPQVPFSVFVEGLDEQGLVGSITLQPKLTTDPSPLVSGDAVGQPDRSLMTRARITLVAKAGFQFAAGDVVKEAPPGSVTPSRTTTRISWEDALPLLTTQPQPQVYALNQWRLQHADGSVSSTGTRITLTVLPAQGLRMRLHVEIAPSQVTSTQPPTHPCLAEACDPARRPRFPVPLPWLHADRTAPGEAADPKVIVLAVLYAVSISKIVQNGPTVTEAVRAEQEAIAAALNLAAWKLLFGNVAVDERVDLLEALRRLFDAWCKALLYPGPRCECGCDPHGVIIGCALVEGGTIRLVDPWGGRRWVVHYPLLAYWGKQFGIQPLDALASKLFDLICCVAHLYPSKEGTQPTPTGPSGPILARTPSAAVPFGTSVLIFDDPANVPRRLAEMGITPVRSETLSPTAFMARVMEAIPNVGVAAPGAPLVHYTVSDLPEMHLIAPTLAAAPVKPRGGEPGEPSVSGDRVNERVRAAIASRTGRTAVPALLRETSVTMTRELLDAIQPKPASDAGKAAAATLKEADIATVTELLAADADDLLTTVLHRENAAGLAELLDISERQVAAVAKAVGDKLMAFAGDNRVVSRADLQDAEIAKAFTRELVEALKGLLGRRKIASIVARVIGVES